MNRRELINPRKVMVTVAPTGGMAGKQQNPSLPTQPEEIAETIYNCWKLGASIAAIHARRPDDAATCNPEIYRRINDLVRQRCDIIINNSTGGGVNGDMMREDSDGRRENDFSERLKGTEAGAEMCTFDCQTQIVYGFGSEALFNTSPARCDLLAESMREKGIKPEWEVMCPSHIVQDLQRLIDAGYDQPPHYVNIVLGTDRVFQGALPYTPKVLQTMIDFLPPQSIFCVSAIGPAQLPATTLSILLGGHIRVGLEDNNYYSRGKLATNEQLVERAVHLIRELGCEPATPAEAREMLGLTPVKVTTPA